MSNTICNTYMIVVAHDTVEVSQLQGQPAAEILMCLWISSALLGCA